LCGVICKQYSKGLIRQQCQRRVPSYEFGEHLGVNQHLKHFSRANASAVRSAHAGHCTPQHLSQISPIVCSSTAQRFCYPCKQQLHLGRTTCAEL
jgi:hypothetical protein